VRWIRKKIDVENQHPVTEGISLALSSPAIWIGFVVTAISFITLYRSRSKPMNREQKFILGIGISHIGDALDSTYWLIPWSLHFMNDPNAEWWFASGALPNIFFRQICDIVGATLHLVALLVAFGPWQKKFVIWSTVASFVIGVVYVIVLYMLRLP